MDVVSADLAWERHVYIALAGPEGLQVWGVRQGGFHQQHHAQQPQADQALQRPASQLRVLSRQVRHLDVAVQPPGQQTRSQRQGREGRQEDVPLHPMHESADNKYQAETAHRGKVTIHMGTTV